PSSARQSESRPPRPRLAVVRRVGAGLERAFQRRQVVGADGMTGALEAVGGDADLVDALARRQECRVERDREAHERAPYRRGVVVDPDRAAAALERPVWGAVVALDRALVEAG